MHYLYDKVQVLHLHPMARHALHINRGLLCLNLNNSEEAFNHFAKAYEQEQLPNNTIKNKSKVINILVKEFLSESLNNASVNLLFHANRLEPKNQAVLKCAKNYLNAIANLESVDIRLCNRALNIAFILSDTEKHQHVLKLLPVMELLAKLPKELDLLSGVYFKLSMFDKAEMIISEKLKQNINDYDSYLRLADVLIKQRKCQLAIEQLQALLTLNPPEEPFFLAHRTLGLAYWMTNQPELAIASIEIYRRKYTEDSLSIGNLIGAYLHIDIKKAELIARSLTEKQKEDPHIQPILSFLKVEKNRLGTEVKLDENDKDPMSVFFDKLLSSKQYEEAEKLARQMIAVDVEHKAIGCARLLQVFYVQEKYHEVLNILT